MNKFPELSDKFSMMLFFDQSFYGLGIVAAPKAFG